MESFDNAGSAIRDMVPHMLSRPAERWSDWLTLPLARCASWMVAMASGTRGIVAALARVVRVPWKT